MVSVFSEISTTFALKISTKTITSGR
uniref:Uncharacterized protein n=1 Tax=Arundo donax TaxID=35708 RepID=A0A0A9EVH9_ARUDO